MKCKWIEGRECKIESHRKIYKVQDQDEYMSEILIKIPDEKTKPVDLKRLSGIASVGGDALEDTERFYSYNSDPRIKRGENYGGKGHQSENTGTS